MRSLCYNFYMTLDAIALTSEEIQAFCRKHHIRRMAFFGSVVREDFSAQSDVDVLVEFDPNHIPGFRFFLIQSELAKLLGRPVDLQTPNFLNPEVLESALSEAVIVYEQT